MSLLQARSVAHTQKWRVTLLMRIGVLLSNQAPDSPPEHFISKALAAKFLTYYHNGKKAVLRLSERLLHIQVNLTFGKLKELLRARTNGIVEYLPIREWKQSLLLTYPIRNQTSYIYR